MAWIRLSDDYNDHPKFDNLSDGAFRLWHQAMGFCRKFQTDGLVPLATVRKFKAFSQKRMTELLNPWKPGENPLWCDVPSFGIRVHDYLEWNLSKEEELAERDGATKRMQKLRQRRRDGASDAVRDASHRGERSPLVPGTGRIGSVLQEKMSEKTPEDFSERAGRLRQELYPAWYSQHRHGARLSLLANSVEFDDALRLVQTWDDGRLEKLAKIVLTTDDPWISRTDRGFKIFALKATWADEKLAAWEHEHGVAV